MQIKNNSVFKPVQGKCYYLFWEQKLMNMIKEVVHAGKKTDFKSSWLVSD